VAACLVIEAAGRTAAYVPVVETMVYGAAAHRRSSAPPAQRRPGCPASASGETILTAAMAELVGEVILPGGTSPATTATAKPTALGARSGPRPACRRPSWPTPSSFRPRASAADGPPGSGVFIVDADADG
jgi:hypothetical protein